MPKQFEAAAIIQAPVERVWRALIDPAEVVMWDGAVESVEQLTQPYPRPGQHARWRYRLGPMRVTLHDQPLEVAPEELFRSRIRVGPFNLDETYELAPEGDEAARLSLRLRVWLGLSLLGPLLDQFVSARVARASVRGALVSIKSYCEEMRRAERLAAASEPQPEAEEAAPSAEAAGSEGPSATPEPAAEAASEAAEPPSEPALEEQPATND
jgi:hypothetical protein